MRGENAARRAGCETDLIYKMKLRMALKIAAI